MTLHEISHGYVAFWLGDYTPKAQGRLSFNPLKHLDPVLSLALPLLLALAGAPIFGGAKPVQINPHKLKWNEWGMALVAISGPITNLILAFISFNIVYYFGTSMPELLSSALVLSVHVNLGFCVFNMIPIPPLDGSRVLFALAPDFVRNAMQKIEQFGIMIVFLIVVVASPLLSTLVGGGVSFIIDVFSKLVI